MALISLSIDRHRHPKYALPAIPLFILGETLGIAERMIRFFRILIDNLPGGMGIVGTVVCLFWGAVSDPGPASTAAIGPMIIKGYGRWLHPVLQPPLWSVRGLHSSSFSRHLSVW